MSFVHNDEVNVLSPKLCKQVVLVRASAEGVKIRDDHISFEEIFPCHTAYWCVLSIESHDVRRFASWDQRTVGQPV